MQTDGRSINPGLAIIFPGQGSQSVGMLSALAESYSHVGETFEEASDALGYDLWQLTQQGPEESLNQTDKTQPALLTASVAIWKIWESQCSLAPGYLAGHSLGEYSALVCSGSLDFVTAVKLVEQRGLFMQQAVPAGKGAMAAILGLEDAQVSKLCQQVAEGQVLTPANFNSPGQVVIAGEAEAVDRVLVPAKEAGARKVVPLAVSVPSHCALMRPAADQLEQQVANIVLNKPGTPVINNADVLMPKDAESIKSALLRQLYSSVRWTETIQKLTEEGVSCVIECGPSKVLTGLNRRIDKSIHAGFMNDPASLDKTLKLCEECYAG
jgi:[acyl-carrier-protein] S-malonyltransferase